MVGVRAANRLELLYAKSIQEALTQLEQKEVAVLVADIDMEAENYLVFFNLLVDLLYSSLDPRIGEAL